MHRAWPVGMTWHAYVSWACCRRTSTWLKWYPTKLARHSQHLHVAHNFVTCFLQHPFKFTKLRAFVARHTDIYENKTRLPVTTPKTQVSYSGSWGALNMSFVDNAAFKNAKATFWLKSGGRQHFLVKFIYLFIFPKCPRFAGCGP